MSKLNYNDMMELEPGTVLVFGGRIFEGEFFQRHVTEKTWEVKRIFLGLTRDPMDSLWKYRYRSPGSGFESEGYFCDAGIVPYSHGHWNKYNYCKVAP